MIDVVIVGQGRMGRGIAQLITSRGIRFCNVGADLECQKRVMSNAEIIVEAITEDFSKKQLFFKTISDFVPSDAIIGTNTSSLSVEELATSVANPSRFCGFHFMNPPEQNPIVEIAPHTQTSLFTVAKLCGFARRLDKTPIVVHDTPGFIVNRILFPALDAAIALVEDGTDEKTVDDTIKTALKWPLGPFEIMDLIGWKTGAIILENLTGRQSKAEILRRFKHRTQTNNEFKGITIE